MGSGQYSTLIDVLKSHDEKDEKTGETETVFKPHHRKFPAKREDVSGGSTRRGLQVEDTIKTVFTIPFVEDIGSQWRVQVITAKKDGPIYDIVSVIEPNDRREDLELHCSAVV